MNRVLPVLTALTVAAIVWGPGAAQSHETVTTTVLFDREIVRILNAHCVMCHVEQGPAFPLETYEQVWLQKRKISAAVLARHMPPWAALPGYGQFANENVVTLRESQFMVSWVEGLGPRNAGTVFTNTVSSRAPNTQPARARADFGRWQLGEPDRKIRLGPITIEASPARRAAGSKAAAGDDFVTHSTVDLGLTSASRIRAVEYMPGDRRVLRAAFFTVQETGQWIGSWTPWHGFVKFPANSALALPAGSHVVAELHYRRGGETSVDRGTLGLSFVDRPSPLTVTDLVIDAKGEVAAGATSQRFQARTVLAAETDLLALRPDLRPGVRSIEVSAKRPDGGTDVLLFAKDIPLDWPTPYLFRNPVRLRRGTTLSVTAYYSNSGAAPSEGGVHLTLSTIKR